MFRKLVTVVASGEENRMTRDRSERNLLYIEYPLVSFKFCLMYRYYLLEKLCFSLFRCSDQMVPESTRGVLPD